MEGLFFNEAVPLSPSKPETNARYREHTKMYNGGLN